MLAFSLKAIGLLVCLLLWIISIARVDKLRKLCLYLAQNSCLDNFSAQVFEDISAHVRIDLLIAYFFILLICIIVEPNFFYYCFHVRRMISSHKISDLMNLGAAQSTQQAQPELQPPNAYPINSVRQMEVKQFSDKENSFVRDLDNLADPQPDPPVARNNITYYNLKIDQNPQHSQRPSFQNRRADSSTHALDSNPTIIKAEIISLDKN